jgi:hypothetical protein
MSHSKKVIQKGIASAESAEAMSIYKGALLQILRDTYLI